MLTPRRFGSLLGLFLLTCLISPLSGAASPEPLIRILSPGDGSVVLAPIELTAEIQPGGDDLVRVSLLDRQNNVLVRQLIRTDTHKQKLSNFAAHLSFEIPEESTPALLTIAIQDEVNRPLSLRSVSLTLESNGTAKITTPDTVASWLEIDQPLPHDTFSGGGFRVEGRVIPLTQKPVIFELITDTGGVIGSSQLAVETPGEPFDFSIPLSYAFITSQRNVRMVIRQTTDPFGINVILDSMPLTLAP